MNVALVIEQLDPRRGGVEQWTWQFARRLIARGHRLELVAAGFAPEVRQLGCGLHEVGKHSSRVAFAEAAEAKLKTLSVDVIHDTGCGWYCDVFQPHGGSRTASIEQNILLAPRAWRPIKRHAQSWLPRYRQFAQLEDKQYGPRERVYLALSRRVAGDLQQHHQVPAEQLRIVYNGVDLERFHPDRRQLEREPIRARLRLGAGEYLALIVAHNFRLKGVAPLIRAVARVRNLGLPLSLAVIGGAAAAPFRKLARQLQIEAQVHFIGSVADAAPWYAAADLYVQPTFYDPCSLVVLEALASGLPVITTQYNGAGELIPQGQAGDVLPNPDDDLALAESISHMCDAASLARMSVAARTVAESHSFDRNCDEIVAVYKEIATHRARRAA
jgi:UDP-glucose:(heptosyl)LPS alpha-1,3-glucosyltransferase